MNETKKLIQQITEGIQDKKGKKNRHRRSDKKSTIQYAIISSSAKETLPAK